MVVLLLRPEALSIVHLQLYKEHVSQCSHAGPPRRAKIPGIKIMSSELTVGPQYHPRFYPSY